MMNTNTGNRLASVANDIVHNDNDMDTSMAAEVHSASAQIYVFKQVVAPLTLRMKAAYFQVSRESVNS
jgi:hypothetical protein